MKERLQVVRGIFPKQKGFTLLEVLIALVVLAIALTSMVMSSTELSKNNSRIADKSIANWVALNTIAKARIGIIKPNYGDKVLQGNEEVFKRKWFWSLSRFKTDDKNTSRIVVAVGFTSNENVIEVTSFLRN